ncbi:hypothetical protein K431DRAFT_283866 [Polychaeton citri CBS 116435]|uniref:Thioesterase domain-containing protein n=1 Tax=Polychaeton citri CBS 116435 TaxID=1314669 RepID=A0A9P4QAK2_9PEZI|nr:hypothetical protein K431DRAFT_283866 [Polychaeton citri CBS 116435]
MAFTEGTVQEIRELTPKQRLEEVLKRAQDSDDFFMLKWLRSGITIKNAEALSPTHCKATFVFKVDNFYGNRSGNLHGGAASAMYDILTTMVLAAMTENGDIWINGGVSRSLDVTYIRPAPEGEVLECSCEIVSAAKRLALMKAEMRRQSDGAVVSTCKHDKASVQIKRSIKL